MSEQPGQKELMEKLTLLSEVEELEKQKKLQEARSDFTKFTEYVIKDEYSGSPIKIAPIQEAWIQHIGFCLNNNIHALILAPMSSGKCVHPDTSFFTKEFGRLEAKDLRKGDEVLSWSDKNTHVWSKVAAVEEQWEEECYEIELNSGKKMICTATHPMLTIDGWVPAGNLRENVDFVICPLGWDVLTPLNCIEEDLAYAIGMSAVAGSMSRGQVELVGKTKKKRLQAAVDKFALQVNESKFVFTISTTAESQLTIEDVFNCESEIPSKLYCASETAIKNYISGVFDGCGRFDTAIRAYKFHDIKNKEFAYDLMLLLQRLGVNSFIKKRINVRRAITNYEVVVCKNSAFTFYGLPCEQFKMTQKKPEKAEGQPPYSADLVVKVTALSKLTTLGVEVEGTHTHITEGMVSHNTQIVSVALPLYFLGKNTSSRIKLVCLSDDAAKDRLSSIRTYIESDEDYQAVFPRVVQDKSSEWTRHRLFVDRQTRAAKDASLDAKGVLAAAIGGRCDYLLVDDIFDYRTAIAQPALRKQIIDTYNQVWLTRLEPKKSAIIICTRWHERDLAGEILNNPLTLERYGILIQRVADDFNNIECEVVIPDALQEKYKRQVKGYK